MQVVNLLRIPTISWIGVCMVMIAWSTEFITSIYLFRDTLDWVVVSKKAANARDMADQVQRAIQGFESWGINKGHAAILWKSPATDMGLLYRSLQRSHERLRALAEKYDAPGSTLSKNAAEYSQTLLDVKQVHEVLGIEARSHYYWVIRRGFPFEIFFWAGLALFCYGVVGPLVREITWVEVMLFTLFMLALLHSLLG